MKMVAFRSRGGTRVKSDFSDGPEASTVSKGTADSEENILKRIRLNDWGFVADALANEVRNIAARLKRPAMIYIINSFIQVKDLQALSQTS